MTSCNPGSAFIFPSDFWFLPRARGGKEEEEEEESPKDIPTEKRSKIMRRVDKEETQAKQ